MNNSFVKEYRRLNREQKMAVDAIEGPVLVLAGPGTGKTQVLTLRIANILRKTQMNPYNILCLTFTESAAYTMRERLSNFIGPDAYSVEIQTFHGFANSVIKDFPYTFNTFLSDSNGDKEFIDYKALDDFERLHIIKNLLTQNAWRHLSPLKANLTHLANISGLLQDLKRENITPQKLFEDSSKQVDNLKKLALSEKISRTEKAKIKTEIKKAKRTKELADLFKKYQQILAQKFLYDYEDMISWVVEAFRQDSELSLIYQEKFQYILVDEYQDSNGSQLELLKCLTSFYKKNPNLFVVGDPNQSIYRFQGASKYNIESFKTDYKNAVQITLKTNYRNPQNLINNAKNLAEDSKPAKQTAHSKNKASLKLLEFTHKEQEIYEIASYVKKEINSGVKANEIAILVRRNNQITDFINALTQAKIPFQVVKGNKVLSSPYIKKILLLVDCIINPADKHKLIELFYYFRQYFSFKDAYLFQQAVSKDKKLVDLSPEAKSFLQKLQDTAGKINELPIANALTEIFKSFKIVENLLAQKNRLEKLNLLKSLYNNAKEENLPLKEWLQKIKEMRELNLDIQSEPILYGEEEAVVVSTVHQAKGKEYKTVFMPQLEQRVWSHHNRSIFFIPQFTSNADEDATAEERRLFYVGITRTKNKLYLSYSKFDKDKEITPSRFLKELPKTTAKTIIKEKEELTIKRLSKQLSPASKLALSRFEAAWLKDVVAKQPLSPTGFLNYKFCPQNYLFNNVLRIPKVKSASLSFGSAVHLALELFFRDFKEQGVLPPLSELLKHYKFALEKEPQLTEKQKKQYQAEGEELLKKYYLKKSAEFQAPVRTEFLFSHVRLGEIPLSGKVDKIEWIDKKKKIVRVIDYKTGRIKSRRAMLDKNKPQSHNNLYQLKFYQLLSELDYRFYLNWKIGESTIQFLDKDHKFTAESFNFSKKEIDDLKDEIKRVWQDIQNLKFFHNPEAGDRCDFCDVIR